MQHPHSKKLWAACLLAPLIVLLGAGLAQPSLAKTAAQKSAGLNQPSVEMPKNDAVYPDRPGAESLDRNCLGCHSSEIVVNQPALSRDVWHAEIDKMRTAFGAKIDPDDIETIIGYLTAMNGVTRNKWR